MKKIDSLTVKFRDRTVGTLSLTPDNRQCVFGYDREWLGDGFSISPELPLRQGVFIAKPMPFNGNFGVFEDSLPDGYGRYLLHKALMREGINDTDLSALDRLAIVGKGGMGGLTFSPSIDILERNADFSDFDVLQTKALEVLGERQDGDAEMLLYNSGNSGGARPKAIYEDADGHWLVKFRHIYDPKDIGKQEYKYNAIARDCGITVPDFKLINGRYFASRRFDIAPDGNRRHTATAGGLLRSLLAIRCLIMTICLPSRGFLPKVRQMSRRCIAGWSSTILWITRMTIARISVLLL